MWNFQYPSRIACEKSHFKTKIIYVLYKHLPCNTFWTFLHHGTHLNTSNQIVLNYDKVYKMLLKNVKTCPFCSVSLECRTHPVMISHNVSHHKIWQRVQCLNFSNRSKILPTSGECNCRGAGQIQSHIDGLVQERRTSIADAMELRLSCAKPSA